MSTRSNIRLTYSDRNKVVFYQHWDGNMLSDTLKKALVRGKSRWDDAPYLARIIFCEMVKDDVEGLTGWGITTEVPEENWFTLDVNLEEQMVEWVDREGKGHCVSFAEFID